MSEVRAKKDFVFDTYDDLPAEFRWVKKENSESGDIKIRRDLITPFKNGKEWAYEPMLVSQPRTAKVLLSGDEFKLVVRKGITDYVFKLVHEVNGQIIQTCRNSINQNPDDPGYSLWIERYRAVLKERWPDDPSRWEPEQRHLSLPRLIRMAYYERIDGLGIPDSVGFGPFTRILPYPIGRPWETIDGYLKIFRLGKKYLPLLEEMIPDVRPKIRPGESHFSHPYLNFMMFLNSWGSFIGKKRTDGDHLFVKNHIQDGVVYYIRDADVPNMMILADPVEAIDRYCEHVLLRKEERFDFRPWAIPFV